MFMQDSPRHGFVLHFRVCLSDPTQYFPPYPRGGLVHVRLRYCDPVPHVLEHWHHFPQGLHPPSALKREKRAYLQSGWIARVYRNFQGT